MQKGKKLEIYKAALDGTGHSTVMLVCINGHRSSRPYGDIVCSHFPKLMGFIGIHELILAIDEVCQRAGVPMSSTEPRFINRSRAERYQKLSGEQAPMDTQEQRKTVEGMISFLMSAGAVVIVEVMSRQHSSMQGRIRCGYTGTGYVSFRSALELMRMLKEIDEEIQKKGFEK